MGQFIGILSGLGAMVGWGIADFFAAKSSKETSPLQTKRSLVAFKHG